MSNRIIKTRFCPSPTGNMHLGNARTALFNYLYAKSIGGDFLLRIEDTDRERSKEIFDTGLQQDLLWLGLPWQEGPNVGGDNGPYHQSRRQAIYDDYYHRLTSTGTAYSCFCSEEKLALTRRMQRASGQPPRYPGTCRSLSETEIAHKITSGEKPTLRFRVPDDEAINFTDMVRGKQHFKTRDIGDFIIRRGNGTSPFMFCNAIDDALMGVNHALRGEDHLTNTPRQIMILKALGLPIPSYGHISLIVAIDGSPLSKRNGSLGISELREMGYLPEAIVNYLSRMGHHYSNENFMTNEELASLFKADSLSKSPAKFNKEQLDYWQKEAMSRLTSDALWEQIDTNTKGKIPKEKKDLFIETVQPNIHFPQETGHWVDVCFDSDFKITEETQLHTLAEAGKPYFSSAASAYEQFPTDFKQMINVIKTEQNVKGKALFQPLRIALTGNENGPELAKILQIMDPRLVKQRLQEA
jgi:glutamyl-tRNA synthetase